MTWTCGPQTAPEESPEEPGWDTLTPHPHHLLPCQCLCWHPRKEDSLEKAVGSRNQPAGVDEDSSTDMQALVHQAGLPWPLASHHILTTRDPPHHLGFPARCGDSPATYNRDMGETPNATTREAPSTSQMGKPRASVQWPGQKDTAAWTLPLPAATENLTAEHNGAGFLSMKAQGCGEMPRVTKGGNSSWQHIC